MEVFRTVVLVIAAIASGFMAGVFGQYAIATMPGLARTDNRTFVGAFQAIDAAIVNRLFLAIFLGTLVITGLSAVLHLGADQRSVLAWIVVAFVLYLVVVMVTLAVNVPLNDSIKAAGEPDRIADLASVRERFNESRWVRWNLVRVVLSTAACGSLVWALVLHGRASGS